MGRILYFIAVILIVGWAISFFGGYVEGGVIHLVLLFAVILILIDLLGSRKDRV